MCPMLHGWMNAWTNKYEISKIWKYYSMVSSTNSCLSTYFSKAISTSLYTHTLLYEHWTMQNDHNINVTKALLSLKSHFWTGAQISILS